MTTMTTSDRPALADARAGRGRATFFRRGAARQLAATATAAAAAAAAAAATTPMGRKE